MGKGHPATKRASKRLRYSVAKLGKSPADPYVSGAAIVHLG